MLTVSLVPTFWCDGHCPYCYLGDLRKDDTVISNEVLDSRLEELSKRFDISVDIFGGNVEKSVDNTTLIKMVDTVRKYTDKVSLTTMLEDGYDTIDVSLAVSLNEERGHIHTQTLERLKAMDSNLRKTVTVMMVVLPSLLKKEYGVILDSIESLGIKSVTFLQYYKSYRCKKVYDISNKDYENFMIGIIDAYRKKDYNFSIGNLDIWTDNYVPLRSSNIFILPNGQYATLEYDKDGYEDFRYFDSLSEYEDSISEEIVENSNCLCCEMFGQCLAEHIRPTLNGDVCSGLPNLRNHLETIGIV